MLNDLQLAEFIYEQPAVGDVEYTFKHALTHEVAYNSIQLDLAELSGFLTGYGSKERLDASLRGSRAVPAAPRRDSTRLDTEKSWGRLHKHSALREHPPDHSGIHRAGQSNR